MGKKSQSSATSRKSSSRVKSDVINTSSINVSAPEIGVNSNSVTNTIGLTGVTSSLSMSADHASEVNCGRTNKVSGHNNAASQIDTLIKVDEIEQKAKEDRLYNKVVSHFLAPVFDADKRKAELLTGHVLAGGSITPAIIAKVDEMVLSEKKTFNEKNPAPLCTTALVLDVIKNNYDNEFKNVVGCSASAIKISDIKTYSRSLGVLLSVSLPDDATAQLIVRSVLSYKYLLLDRAAQAKLRSHDNGNYYDGLRMAMRAGVELGRSDDTIIEDCKYYLRMIRESDSRELSKHRTNYYKYRALLDDISRQLSVACPALVDVVCGAYIVYPDRAKKIHVPAKVKTDLLPKYRGAVSALSRINAALYGVTSF